METHPKEEPVSLTVDGTVGKSVYVTVFDSANTTVRTGDVSNDTVINPPAVNMYANGEKARATVTVEDIKSEDQGINIAVGEEGGTISVTSDKIESTKQGINIGENSGGSVTVKSDNIESKDKGVEIKNNHGGTNTVTTEAIHSGGTGVSIDTNGGTNTVTTGKIDATDTGVYISTGAEENKNFSRMLLEDFEALNLGDPIASYEQKDEEENWIHNIYQTQDGTSYWTKKINGDNIGYLYVSSTPALENGLIETITKGNITVTGKSDTEGFEVFNKGENQTVKGAVIGDITVTGEQAAGVYLQSGNPYGGSFTKEGDENYPFEKSGNQSEFYDHGSSTTTFDGTGKISVDGEDATAIKVVNGYKDTTTATFTGVVEAKGEDSVALDTENDGGDIDVTIKGKVTSDGTGLELSDNAYPNRVPVTDELPFEARKDEYIEDQFIDGKLYQVYLHVDEGGNETYYYCDTDNDEIRISRAWTIEESENPEGPGESTNRVEVIGDVEATKTGIHIELSNDQASMDVIVDGTVSGKTQSVLVSQETISDNLTLTVWEIKKNDAGNVVERETADGTTEADRDIEKNIQYIIKIEPSQQGIIKTQGTTEYEGYNVAKEGETVTLKIEVPEGYQIKNAFSDSDQTLEMAQDDDGNYYLIVPKGGAVMISVEFEKIPGYKSGFEPGAGLASEAKNESTPASAVGETETGTTTQSTVSTLLTLYDKTSEMSIILYSDGTYKAVLSNKQVDYGTFAAKDDHITLTSKTGKTIEVAKDGSNWKLTFSGEGDKTYEFAISAEEMQGLVDALKK